MPNNHNNTNSNNNHSNITIIKLNFNFLTTEYNELSIHTIIKFGN